VHGRDGEEFLRRVGCVERVGARVRCRRKGGPVRDRDMSGMEGCLQCGRLDEKMGFMDMLIRGIIVDCVFDVFVWALAGWVDKDWRNRTVQRYKDVVYDSVPE
jgi:hypothetical protein